MISHNAPRIIADNGPNTETHKSGCQGVPRGGGRAQFPPRNFAERARVSLKSQNQIAIASNRNSHLQISTFLCLRRAGNRCDFRRWFRKFASAILVHCTCASTFEAHSGTQAPSCISLYMNVKAITYRCW